LAGPSTQAYLILDSFVIVVLACLRKLSQLTTMDYCLSVEVAVARKRCKTLTAQHAKQVSDASELIVMSPETCNSLAPH
jgi:hypothetical protein